MTSDATRRIDIPEEKDIILFSHESYEDHSEELFACPRMSAKEMMAKLDDFGEPNVTMEKLAVLGLGCKPIPSLSYDMIIHRESSGRPNIFLITDKKGKEIEFDMPNSFDRSLY